MGIKKELITEKDPKSPISEVFRTLRTNIQFMNTSKRMKTLLITSSYPGEGKSWVASNLAVTFAQTGKKVLLIDADLRKGRQNVIFGVFPKPGLSNCLVDIDLDNFENFDISKYIQNTDVENLILMPSGDVPPNPSELLLSKQMSKLLETLKGVCDLIIIDGTPCDLVTDSVILSRIADATLIVTAHKETKKEGLDRTIKSIQNVGGRIAGVVINKMPVSISKYNEKYYYESHNSKSSKKKGFFASFHNKNKDKKESYNKDKDEKIFEKDDIDNIYNKIYSNEYDNDDENTNNNNLNDKKLVAQNVNNSDTNSSDIKTQMNQVDDSESNKPNDSNAQDVGMDNSYNTQGIQSSYSSNSYNNDTQNNYLSNNNNHNEQNNSSNGYNKDTQNSYSSNSYNQNVQNNYSSNDYNKNNQNGYSTNNDNQNTGYVDKSKINNQNYYSENNYNGQNFNNYSDNNFEDFESEKTKQIFNQINSYLDKEKSELK